MSPVSVKMSWITTPLSVVMLVVLFCLSGNLLAETQDYQNTINALQIRYADEVQAHRKYGLYAHKAQQEGYPHVAHLFRSLAASEAIHAKNFKSSLKALGQEPKPPTMHEIEVTTTKHHLKHATTVEAEEIDQEYPKILASISPENYQPAIESITFAWESEKQHRDLIVKIQKAVSNWFRLVISRIEGKSARYFVCQVCGSTLTEVPATHCPICNHSNENYSEVQGFPKVKKKPSTNILDY